MKKILSAAFFSVGCIAVVPLYADNTSGMPDWSEPTRTGAFDANGAGKVSFSFSSSGGTKTGPGGTATYSFNIPKGNVVSVSVSADDSATVSVPAANVSASSRWDASQKKIVPGEATSVFVDTDEISGDTIPVTITYSNAGGPYSLSFTVSVERVKADVSTVNISAPSKLVLSQDDGTPFDGNDWEKNRSRNGTLRESNPISVTSGNVLTFVPSFEIIEDTLPENVRAEFSVPGSTTVSQIKDYASISSGIELPAPVAAGNIDYFDNSLTVTWSVQYSGCDKWFPAGTSSHEIYFTRTAPGTDLRQETLFWVACSGSVCGKATDAEITDAIWSKFSTGTGPANLTRKDGTPMKYWGQDEQTPDVDASGLISGADGRCGAWTSFLREVLRFHGISSSQAIIYPKNEEYGLLVKNYEFSTSSTLGLPPPFTHVIDFSTGGSVAAGTVKDRVGIFGQNNSNPYSIPANHGILFGDEILDPSYGISQSDLADYGNQIIEGSTRKEPYNNMNIATPSCEWDCLFLIQKPDRQGANPTRLKQSGGLVGVEGFCRGGGTPVYWKVYRGSGYISLFAGSTEETDDPFSFYFGEGFRKELEENGLSAPVRLRRIELPFQSKKILRMSDVKPFLSVDGNFSVSAKIFGYDFSFEYDSTQGKWLDLNEGVSLIEPASGEVSETLWVLHVLKRRGMLERIEPENYPVFGVSFSSEELKDKTPKDIVEMIRLREEILREAIVKEFKE